MNLIRATLRALVEETLKLRFGGGKSDPETSNPNNHGETNFQTMAKNHRCFGKRSRTDTQNASKLSLFWCYHNVHRSARG